MKEIREKIINAIIILFAIAGLSATAYFMYLIYKSDQDTKSEQAALDQELDRKIADNASREEKRLDDKIRLQEKMTDALIKGIGQKIVDETNKKNELTGEPNPANLKKLETKIEELLTKDQEAKAIIRDKYQDTRKEYSSAVSLYAALQDEEVVDLFSKKAILAMKEEKTNMTEADIKFMVPVILGQYADAVLMDKINVNQKIRAAEGKTKIKLQN